jgi:DnaJ-class molecular chaperone
VIVSPIKAAEAAALLGINLATMTSDELSAAFRAKAKDCHPDKLGPDTPASPEWARISWAKECLTYWLQQRPVDAVDSRIATGPPCHKCGGVGRVRVAGRRFGAPLTIMCTNCRGVGTIEPEEDDHD